MNKQLIRLLVVFVAVLLGSGLLVYVLLQGAATPVRNSVTERSSTSADQPTNTPTPPEGSVKVQNGGNNSIINELFGLEPSDGRATAEARGVVAARVLLRFLLAAFLAMLLAFRWRRGVSVTRRNPYVAQTQILLGVVAASMMMVVGDSAARAFGIFAAASLVRFRTNIRDPKEITVLLICLGVGLAAGIGRWDMAVILTLFVLLSLAILEYFEQSQVFRSMELCVKTRNVDRTTEALKQVFATHKFDTELRELDREDADDPMGTIVYLVNVHTNITTSRLSDEILSADPDNIDSVEWEQKESSTYIYR